MLQRVVELTGIDRSEDESILLLDGGAEAFPQMLRAIEKATASVHVEVYTFSWDGVGRRFVHALAQAARRGVKVRVIVDGWGSLLSGNAVAGALRAAGCDVTVYHPFSALLLGRLRRNHRKLLLVDDQVAFVGGINIGQEYETRAGEPGWADLAVEVTGPAVAALGARLRKEERAPVVGSRLRIHLSGLGGGRKLRRRYLKAFGSATRQLVLAHAYFLPDSRVARSLRAASHRGVEVRLLLAGRSDVPFARVAALRLYRSFLKAGIRIFEWHQSVLHAKAALVDGRRFLVGSFNLDPLSLANLEALVETDDPTTAGAAQAWLEEKLSHAKEVTLADCERSFLQRHFGDAFGLFAARLTEWVARLIAFRRPLHLHEAGEHARLPRLGVKQRRRGGEKAPPLL